MRVLRRAGWALLGLVVLLAAGLGVFALTFDTRAQVARLAAQVRRATGRDLAVSGPVRIAFWPPGVVAEGVSLSNPPGASRPSMITADAVRARIALNPLLSGRAELDVTLVHPDLLLENNNWRFTPEPPPPQTEPSGPSRQPWLRAELRRVRVEDGSVAVRHGAATDAAVVPTADVTLDGAGGLAAWAQVNGTTGAGAGGAFTLSASAGPGGFPLHAKLDGGLDADRKVSLTAEAVAADQPGHVHLTTVMQGLPVTADVTTPLWRGGPLPFTLSAAVAGATLTAQGTLADPAALSGLDTTVSARIPDLPALSPLAGTKLPGLGAVSLDGRVLAPSGLRTGVSVRSLRFNAGPGNLAGDVAAGWGERFSLRGSLTSSRLDLDAVAASWPHPVPASSGSSTPGPAPNPAPAAPSDPAPRRLIPDVPLPLGLTRAVDLDLSFGLANLVVSGQAITGLDGTVSAGNGRARVDPLLMTLPAGRVTGSAIVDAAAAPPAWSLAARGAGLRLDRASDQVHGTLDADIALTATGATTTALAGSLDGRANLLLVDGDVDNRLLFPLLDAALKAAHVALDGSGRTQVRCLLLPLTAAHGTVSTPGMVLDTPRFRVDGEGSADLAAETLALQLRPALLLGGGASVEAPVRVSGPMLHPAASLGDGSGRTGVRIGLGGRRPLPDACGPDRTPDPAATATKPGDLLKGLLR